LGPAGGKDFDPLLVDDGVSAAVVGRPAGNELGELLFEPDPFGG